MKKGFSLVEVLLVMGIFAILIALGSINYFATYSQTSVGVTRDVLVSDLRTAQNKAMSGATIGGTPHPSWGVKLEETSYTIFPGPTYTVDAPGNYVVSLPSRMTLTTTFPSGEILFIKGSGEIVSYDSSEDSITLNIDSSNKTIELNQLGVITSL